MRDKLDPGDINGGDWGLGAPSKDEQIEDNVWKITGYSYREKVKPNDLRRILTKRG